MLCTGEITNLVEAHQDILMPHIKVLRLPVSEKNFLCSWAQTCDPHSGSSFDPRDILCTRVLLQDARCQVSKLYAFQFQRRKILKFSIFVPFFLTCDSSKGGANFDPREHHTNKLGRDPLGDATNQISSSTSASFRRKEI